MEIEIKKFSNYAIIPTEGQFLEGKQTDSLSVCIKKLINKNELNIVLDFYKTTYISSTVIGFLVKTNLELLEKGGKLALINVNNSIKEVLKITNVHQTILIIEDANTIAAHF